MTTVHAPYGCCRRCGTPLEADNSSPTSRDLYCPRCDWMPGDPPAPETHHGKGGK